MDDVLSPPIAFEWDAGNQIKKEKHQVRATEAEESFFDPRKKWFPDPRHSDRETRLILLGKTVRGRILFIVFTMRVGRVRIISARDLNARERKLYEEKITSSKV